MSRVPDVNQLLKALTDDAYGIDGLVSRLTDGASVQRLWTLRQGRIDGGGDGGATVAHKEHSLWKWCGVPYSGGVDPTSWANPTRTTQGALGQADPVTALRLLYANAWLPQGGQVTLYDRLAHCGGLDGNTTSTQNVNGGSDGTITRGTSYVGNEIWVEIYADLGSTAREITVNYKNQAGASKTTPPRIIGGTGNQLAGRILRMPLAEGDTGVSAVVSCAIAVGGTGTTGNFGITIARPLVTITVLPFGPGAGVSFLEGAAPEIEAGACIAYAMIVANSAADTHTIVEMLFVEDEV